jgi:hypothetical protein
MAADLAQDFPQAQRFLGQVLFLKPPFFVLFVP